MRDNFVAAAELSTLVQDFYASSGGVQKCAFDINFLGNVKEISGLGQQDLTVAANEPVYDAQTGHNLSSGPA